MKPDTAARILTVSGIAINALSFSYTILQLATWQAIQLVHPYFRGVIVYLMGLLLVKAVFGLELPIVGSVMIRPERKQTAVWALLISGVVGIQITMFFGLGFEGVLWGCIFFMCAGIVTAAWEPTVEQPEQQLSGKKLP